MTDDEVLPIDGGDHPDDRVLKARVLRAYLDTPPSDERMVTRCVRAVLERARDASDEQPIVKSGISRRWMAASAVAATLLVATTVFWQMPVSPAPDSADVATSAETTAGTAVASATPVAGGIQFDLRLPQDMAAKVSIVGDFNGWDASATPMVKDARSGEWSAKITLLPGRHIYAYVVDGKKWVVDPLAPQIPDAGYGPANALVVEEGPK